MQEIIQEIDFKIDNILRAISGNPIFTQGHSMLDRLDRIEHSLYSGAGHDLIIGSAAIANQLTSTNYAAGSAGWLIDKSGNVEFQDGVFRGTIYAEAGEFSGSVDISGDLTVGTAPNRIYIQGSNDRIISENYSADVSGFLIDGNGGNAEFNNIKVRGEIRSSVLAFNEVQVISGSSQIAQSAAVLMTSLTTVASPTTFNVDVTDPPSGHSQLFSSGDILLLKAGGVANWLSVSSVSDESTFFRYVCVLEDGTPSTWTAGSAVISYGSSGDGVINLSADDSNGPFISVATHAGEPWTTLTEKLRLGNLNNSFGVTSANYGMAFGDYANDNYMLFNADTNKFLLSAGGGKVSLDEDGLVLAAASDATEDPATYVRWLSSSDGDIAAVLRCYELGSGPTGSTYAYLDNRAPNTDAAHTHLYAKNTYISINDQSTFGDMGFQSTHNYISFSFGGIVDDDYTNFYIGCGDNDGTYAGLYLGHPTTDHLMLKHDRYNSQSTITAPNILTISTTVGNIEMTADEHLLLAGTDGGVTITSNGAPLNLSSFTGDVHITDSDLDLDDNSVISDDGDTAHLLGRANIGYLGFGDVAGFAHRDFANTTDYALLQNSAGNVWLNAPTGLAIYFDINHSTIMNMTASRLQIGGGARINNFLDNATHIDSGQSTYLATSASVESYHQAYCTGSQVVRRTSNQTIANATLTALSFTENYWNSNGNFWSGGSPTRLTADVTGWYIVSGWVQWDSNATGVRLLWLNRNGVQFASTRLSALANLEMYISQIMYLSAGDYVELYVYQNSGANRTINYNGGRSPYFGLARYRRH